MATQEQIYTTKVILNSTEAKNEISALQKEVDELRKKKKDAANTGEWKEFYNGSRAMTGCTCREYIKCGLLTKKTVRHLVTNKIISTFALFNKTQYNIKGKATITMKVTPEEEELILAIRAFRNERKQQRTTDYRAASSAI